MRKSIIFTIIAASGLVLSACSQKTEDAAETTADSAAADVAGAADAAGNAAAGAADAAGNAAEAAATNAGKAVDNAAAATDEMGAKVGNKAAEVEASAHNESVSEAKRD